MPREPFRFFSLLLELTIAAVALGVFVHGRMFELRTALWTIGGQQGWNSNPRLRIYFYANHQEPPEIPFLWTESLAESLLGIAIVNAVVWMTRAALACSGVNMPLVGALYDLLLSGLWTFGVNSQMSSDLTDTQHLSPHPWYLERSCLAFSGRDAAACRQGKASFTVAVVCM
ncbi:hypothetical protein B0T18DRAFT_313879 [Schizothecium vesticola]|uniref:Uncharacterized protein n=1 Tax=Schizothecium vesticola TaxID=314040 RepID=A0AA40KCE0_9PEZI|nr:hypothetical protein B0T18DRAFT_313879 [Schizothecium vesticola]